MISKILDKLVNIKLFLFDLEGVLLFNDQKSENRSIQLMIESIRRAAENFKAANFKFGIVSARHKDDLVNELNRIENCIVFSTSVDKVGPVEEYAGTLNLDMSNIFYMGDEMLDIPLLKKCGLSASPKNVKREIKKNADFTIDVKSADEVFDYIFDLLKKVNKNGPNNFAGDISAQT